MTTKKFNIGDQVSVLDEAIDGVVVKIEDNRISIETTDKFMMTYFVNELVKTNITSDLDYLNRSDSLAKKQLDLQPTRKQIELRKKLEKVEICVPEFDLHIEKLVKNFRGMNNFDILTVQLETAKKHLEFAIKNRIPKIVFIHGVGEGVLKAELDFMLKRYESILFQEANYQKYGIGATEIYFKKSIK